MFRRLLSVVFILCSFAITLLSCKKDPAPSTNITGDYLIIGHMGGFINPSSFKRYYIITATNLMADTTILAGNNPTGLAQFNFSYTLPDTCFQKVKLLPNQIPVALLSQNNTTVGQVSLADVGYLDMRSRLNGVEYKWLFGNDLSACDTAVQGFVHRVGVGLENLPQ